MADNFLQRNGVLKNKLGAKTPELLIKAEQSFVVIAFEFVILTSEYRKYPMNQYKRQKNEINEKKIFMQFSTLLALNKYTTKQRW